MKAVALLLVLALCVALGACAEREFYPCPDEVSTKCPAVDGDFPTFFAHPNDCSKGCECSRGQAWEIQCQEGLLSHLYFFSSRLTVEPALCHIKEREW